MTFSLHNAAPPSRSSSLGKLPAQVVDIQQLTKTYRHWTRRSQREIRALRGVSLQAHAGEVFGLLGPNGAGKTTLIKALLGVVRPTSGTAALFGKRAGSSAASRRVGYLPESLRIDRHHSARSALRFYGRMSGMDEATIGRRSDELLELVQLQGRDRESVKRFSKGMYQRLGLAQALMHDPDLLVLDEPTDGLDPVGRSQVRQVLEYLRDQGKTIFLNSHILQEVELVCSRVAILAAGEIRGLGTIPDLARLHAEPTAVVDLILPKSLTHEGDLRLSQQPWVADLARRLGIDPQSVRSRVLEPVEHPPAAPLATASSAAPAFPELPQVPPSGISVRLELPTHQQAMVDSAVDFIRESAASIVSLSIKRPSLEQTFLRLVATPGASSTASADAEPLEDRAPASQPLEVPR